TGNPWCRGRFASPRTSGASQGPPEDFFATFVRTKVGASRGGGTRRRGSPRQGQLQVLDPQVNHLAERQASLVGVDPAVAVGEIGVEPMVAIGAPGGLWVDRMAERRESGRAGGRERGRSGRR